MIWHKEFGPQGDGLQDGGRSVVDGTSIAIQKTSRCIFYLSLSNIRKEMKLFLPREHWENGSPVNPTGQVQIGLWFLVVHSALNPQVFGHGSVHFLFKQAK